MVSVVECYGRSIKTNWTKSLNTFGNGFNGKQLGIFHVFVLENLKRNLLCVSQRLLDDVHRYSTYVCLCMCVVLETSLV